MGYRNSGQRRERERQTGQMASQPAAQEPPRYQERGQYPRCQRKAGHSEARERAL